MTPRPRIASLSADATLAEAVRAIRQTGHSRYPVYERGTDDVVGFVHARDVYESAMDGARVTLRELVRPAIAVPAGKAATALLEQMRQEGQHLALVFDEHGSLEGLVTLEDLLEVIVGEIEDEHRVERDMVRDLGQGRLETDGSVPVHELNAGHGLELPESESYVTVAGLVLDRLGHIPKAGESVLVAGRRLTVVSVVGPRVARVRIETEPAPRA
jgi:putative hemolysin